MFGSPLAAAQSHAEPASVRPHGRRLIGWPGWGSWIPSHWFRTTIRAGAAVDAATRDAMVQLRDDNMRQTGGSTATADRVAFGQAIDTSATVLMWDRRGALAGYYLLYTYELEVAGRRRVVQHMRYLHISERCRGHVGLYLSAVVLYLTQALRTLGRPRYIMGPALPNSYVFIERVARTWSLRHEGIPDVERALLTEMGGIVGSGFDPVDGTVAGNAAPKSTGERRSAESRAALARYERLNPGWRSGRALLVTSRMSAWVVVLSVVNTLRRSLRRARQDV